MFITMKTNMNERIRHLRISAAKSQAEFANDLEISMSLLSKIEVGAKEVTPKLAEKIISVYKIKPSTWLYDGKGELEYLKPEFNHVFDPATDTLYNELKDRINEQRTIIDRLTQALIGRTNFRLALNHTGLQKERRLRVKAA